MAERSFLYDKFKAFCGSTDEERASWQPGSASDVLNSSELAEMLSGLSDDDDLHMSANTKQLLCGTGDGSLSLLFVLLCVKHVIVDGGHYTAVARALGLSGAKPVVRMLKDTGVAAQFTKLLQDYYYGSREYMEKLLDIQSGSCSWQSADSIQREASKQSIRSFEEENRCKLHQWVFEQHWLERVSVSRLSEEVGLSNSSFRLVCDYMGIPKMGTEEQRHSTLAFGVPEYKQHVYVPKHERTRFNFDGIVSDVTGTDAWRKALNEVGSWRDGKDRMQADLIERLQAYEEQVGMSFEEAYFKRHVVDGIGISAFAAECGIHPATIKSMLDRTLPKLREEGCKLREAAFDFDLFLERVEEYGRSAKEWRSCVNGEVAQAIVQQLEVDCGEPFAPWFMQEHWVRNVPKTHIAPEGKDSLLGSICDAVGVPYRTQREHNAMAWSRPDPLGLTQAMERRKNGGGIPGLPQKRPVNTDQTRYTAFPGHQVLSVAIMGVDGSQMRRLEVGLQPGETIRLHLGEQEYELVLKK